MSNSVDAQATPPPRVHARASDGTAWGLFFIWASFCLWRNISWGGVLLGAGLIALGAQAERKLCALAMDGFALLLGALLMLAGVMRLMNVEVPFMPLMLAGIGVVLLGSTWLRRS
jgi:hypothetical protein